MWTHFTGFRFEGIVYSTLDRQKPVHPTPQELFGTELARAGNAFGSETQYGESIGNALRIGDHHTCPPPRQVPS